MTRNRAFQILWLSRIVWTGVVVAALTSSCGKAGRDKVVEGHDRTVPELGLELVWVAPGSFQMGSDGGDVAKKPGHEVRIARGFWIGRYEVTQTEYETLMGTNPSEVEGARNPVDSVSWYDAVAFCRKLTKRERVAGRLPAGYAYRLPTEAEWEYAARGGPQSQGFIYAGSNSVDEVAWYGRNSPGLKVQPVGGKAPNELGLHDMSGNVDEWCLLMPSTDPAWKQPVADRVSRGGHRQCSSEEVRLAYRIRPRAETRSGSLGFRAALAPPSGKR